MNLYSYFNRRAICRQNKFIIQVNITNHSRFTKDVFPKAPNSTIAVEFCTKIITLKDASRISVQFWDTGIIVF
jgi:hypothetical protein